MLESSTSLSPTKGISGLCSCYITVCSDETMINLATLKQFFTNNGSFISLSEPIWTADPLKTQNSNTI